MSKIDEIKKTIIAVDSMHVRITTEDILNLLEMIRPYAELGELVADHECICPKMSYEDQSTQQKLIQQIKEIK